MKIEKLARILENTKGGDACKFNRDEGDDGERQGNIQIRVHWVEKRRQASVLPRRVVNTHRPHEWQKAYQISRHDEKKHGHDERKIFLCEFLVLKSFRHIVKRASKHHFNRHLPLSRHQLQGTADKNSRDEEKRYHRPAGEESRGDRQTPESPYVIRRK